MDKELSQDTRPSVPFRTVFLSMVILWGTYFTLITIRSFVVDIDLQYEMLWRRIIVTAVGIVLTTMLWALLRLFDRRALWVKISAAIVLSLPVAVAIGQANQIAFQDITERMEQRYAEERGWRFDDEGNLLVDLPPGTTIKDARGVPQFSESLIIAPAQTSADIWKGVLEIALGRYFLLLAWASTYFALLAGFQARAAERRTQEFRSAAKAAELRSLRYQVNPHFLFNTLNSLSAMVMTGKTESAERMIQTMSRFYRHSLADDPTSDVPLKDEFDLQKLYLDIEATRFPERLSCVFDLPVGLADARVPGMILQPLVENSVKYAVSPVNRSVTIKVAAREEFDRLVITVSDNGPGVPSGIEHGFGIGLANVRDRLEARFGPDIVLSSGPSKEGYSTEMRIPLTRNG